MICEKDVLAVHNMECWANMSVDYQHHTRLLNKQYPFHYYYSLLSSLNNNNTNTNNVIFLCCLYLKKEQVIEIGTYKFFYIAIDKYCDYYGVDTIQEYFVLCKIWKNDIKEIWLDREI